MNKMAGDMHGGERRREAVQTARDKNWGTRRDTNMMGGTECRTIQLDTASVETTEVRRHKERPHIVVQQGWETQGGGPSKLANLDIS